MTAPEMELPDDFPVHFTRAWHEAGHLVCDAMQEMLENMTQHMQADEDGGFVLNMSEILCAAAAMGFSLGAEWRTLHPDADLTLAREQDLAYQISLDHILDESPN